MYLHVWVPLWPPLLPGEHRLVGRNGWERVTTRCWNSSHILQCLRHLHIWVSLIPLECETFGTQKPKDDSYFLYFWISSLPRVNEWPSRGRVTGENTFLSHCLRPQVDSASWGLCFGIPSTWHTWHTWQCALKRSSWKGEKTSPRGRKGFEHSQVKRDDISAPQSFRFSWKGSSRSGRWGTLAETELMRILSESLQGWSIMSVSQKGHRKRL